MKSTRNTITATIRSKCTNPPAILKIKPSNHTNKTIPPIHFNKAIISLLSNFFKVYLFLNSIIKNDKNKYFLAN